VSQLSTSNTSIMGDVTSKPTYANNGEQLSSVLSIMFVKPHQCTMHGRILPSIQWRRTSVTQMGTPVVSAKTSSFSMLLSERRMSTRMIHQFNQSKTFPSLPVPLRTMILRQAPRISWSLTSPCITALNSTIR
jgi:hypothetical protein